jgi:vacuolar protein sorting-associated protein 13A/C
MGSYVVLSLERIGDSVENVPNRVAGAAGTEEQKGQAKVVPKNAVSGVAYGTKSMLGKVFSAVAGVIVEPVKGAKKGGVKGGAKGFGKGMLGLVCKPVKGTIDLVTQTTRGISNTPKTMYVAMNRMIKKKPKQAAA